MPDPFPEFGQCVHKVARDAEDAGAPLPPVPPRGLPLGRRRRAAGSPSPTGLPTDFGFTVLTHPRRGGALWLVPGRGRRRADPAGRPAQVQHSTDAGATWQTQAQGLPHPSYTCVLRDAAAVDTHEQAGLYVGTRNGDVFASADEGATFTRILEQLPDVLCVRVAVVP